MSQYLYEMIVTDKNGKELVLKTNDYEKYKEWLKEYQQSKPKNESRRVLLKG